MAIDLGDIPTGTPPTAGEKLQIRSAIGVGQTDAPTFLAQTLTGQSLTGTQATSLVDLAATWNTSGTPTALKLNVTDTASNAASKLMDLQVGGASKFNVEKTGNINIDPTNVAAVLTLKVGANAAFEYYGGSGWGDQSFSIKARGGLKIDSSTGQHQLVFAADTILARDAAGILAQRNGVSPQAFRVYNTFPGTTANEWFEIDWKTSVNVVKVGVANAGTGGYRKVVFTGGGPGVDAFDFNVGPAAGWRIDSSGHLIPLQNNVFDIGASGANRPRMIYAGTGLSSGGYVQVGSGGNQLIFAGRGVISPSLDGVWMFSNAGSSDFGRLMLGGGTSAFPAIKRNGTGIDIRLADDSAFAPVKGKLTTDTAYTATVVAATGYITIYDSTGTAYRVPCAV